MKFFSIIGDGLALIGDGLAAIGNGMASLFTGSTRKTTPEDEYLDGLHAKQEGSSDWGSSYSSYTLRKKESTSVSITEDGIRKYVRMEDGKVVESENVDDPEAFVKKYTDQADQQFASMDETFKNMDMSKRGMDEIFTNFDDTFKNMFKDK